MECVGPSDKVKGKWVTLYDGNDDGEVLFVVNAPPQLSDTPYMLASDRQP